ncbi:hypothetical protein [Halorubrum lipolyticum]|uniref:Transporter n=1 Tax=Halorubrum lipolyticum DSM 21995 TaxID=1227482 RepID=M0NY82_9EURY|nr:hypothetical protein [Halorubrum lipolyticum]EMA62892.1 transporter [Halorubrum lipolyticum DSM 21995]
MSDEKPENGTLERAETDGQRLGRGGVTSRRTFLATGAAVSAAAVAGCAGGTGSGSTEGPEPPWTTEELADQIDDESTVTIYAANGDRPTWEALVNVINEEFGTSLKLEQYNAHAGAVSQRFMQEHQANSTKADLITTANDVTALIREDGRSVAEKYYETGLEENFWFTDVLNDNEVYPWMVHALNGGAWSVMPINETVFEDRGLDYPESYNDLFEDQYEGLEVALPGYVVDNQIGWIIDYHAAETEMDNMEWMETLVDHLNFVGVESHSTGARSVAEGNTPMMFYNFPSTIHPLMDEYPLRANFVDPVKGSSWKTELSIPANAPNPWVARFVLSATLESAVQRRIIHDVPQVAPGRTDIDYAAEEPTEYMQKRMNADTINYSFEESSQFIEIGQQAKDEGVLDF